MDQVKEARSAVIAQLEHMRDAAMNRLHARIGGFTRPATAFISQPEPKTIGSYARGQQLMAGNFLFAGFLVEARGRSIWQIISPDVAFEAELHGFAWLDDLAAVGDVDARNLAQDWLIEWVERYGRGSGPGWVPELAGRRLIRWINHALFLLNGMEKENSDRYFRNVARQSKFLARRWQSAPAGLCRFEALTGLIYAGLALEGSEHLVTPATSAIADECARGIDPDGGIPSRNPEELMEVFTLLNWAASALSEEGHMPKRPHLLAIERIAPTLRALRHNDGTLARFHGGGRGQEGRLDQALASSGVRATASTGLAMGYARLGAGRTSIVVDASAPPVRGHSYNAHASTLAFEMTSGRRPIVVSCGSGAAFGLEWRRAGRATPSHSTLAIDGFSSSRFAPVKTAGHGVAEYLSDGPGDVRLQQSSGFEGMSLLATHDGYGPTHGLLHVRRIDLSLDGRKISGEDTLGALSETDRITFERYLNEHNMQPVSFDIRFHLHPEIEAAIDLGGTAISLTMQSGEVWVFRHTGLADAKLDASVYLERGRLKPRATKQIVLTSTVLDYSTQISWSLSRAQDGSRHLRDLDDGDSAIAGS